MEEFESLRTLLNTGLTELGQLWTEIGVEDEARDDRKKTVFAQFKNIIDRMLKEETGYKAKLLDHLETNSLICNKLSKELGVPFEEPDPNLSLLKLQHAVRAEARKLEAMKEERMMELLSSRASTRSCATSCAWTPTTLAAPRCQQLLSWTGSRTTSTG